MFNPLSCTVSKIPPHGNSRPQMPTQVWVIRLKEIKLIQSPQAGPKSGHIFEEGEAIFQQQQ